MQSFGVMERLSAALADRYRFESELGAGGMATVFLAEDLKHHRRVAVKVLKPELAAVLGADRFVQEIATTAALQHPHILPLFDSGEAICHPERSEGSASFLYYVMPFIDGETLRAKLDRETQLAVDDAVRIARDVADALDYAHSKGVVHRDIKPENILLANGRPMVADFGIALAVSAAAGGRMTETGLSLGTPHYMSPEQATADKDITARSDIYSLGTVLYEMLSGNPPHTGASAQQIIMKIVTEEATPVTRYRKAVPPNVAAAVAKSLEKLPADRFASAREFADALGNPGFTIASDAATRDATHDSDWRRRFLYAIAGVALLAVVAGSLVARQMTMSATNSIDSPTLHLRLALAAGDRLAVTPADARNNADRPPRTAFAFSPDGASLVIAAERNGVRQLFLRSLAGETETPIPGTEDGETPFFSPDGKSLAFWTGGTLRRISLSGGPPTDIATTSHIIGGSWSDDGRIVVGTLSQGLIVFAVNGARVDTVGGSGAALPQWLPGSKSIICTRTKGNRVGDPTPRIEIVTLDGSPPRVLIEDGADARFASTGHLLFARKGTLLAVAFDLQRLEIRGTPVVVVNDVMQAMNGSNAGVRIGAMQVAVSATGNLAWIPGGVSPDRPGTVFWIDRKGVRTPIATLSERQFHAMRFSPDEKRFSVTTFGSKPSLEVVDIARQSSQTLLTVGQPLWTLWSPDGQRIIRSGAVHDTLTIVSSLADDSRPATAITKTPIDGYPAFWSPDGTELITLKSGQGGLSATTLATGTTGAIANLPVTLRWPTLSPDGKWLAYGVTAAAGGSDIYVQPWPALDRKWKVSTDGGTSSAWTKGGRELVYLAPAGVDSTGAARSRMMAVDIIASGSDFSAGTPHQLFASLLASANPIRSWDVTADGSRFLGSDIRPMHAPPGDIHVLVNWLKAVPELRGK